MRKQLGLVLLSFACGLASPAWAGSPGSGSQGWLYPIALLGKSKKEAFRKPTAEEMQNEFYGAVLIQCEDHNDKEFEGSGHLVRGQRGVKLLTAGHVLQGKKRCWALPSPGIYQYCQKMNLEKCHRNIRKMWLRVDLDNAAIVDQGGFQKEWAVAKVTPWKKENRLAKNFLHSEKFPSIEESWDWHDFQINSQTKEIIAGDGTKHKVKMVAHVEYANSNDTTLRVVDECLVYPQEKSPKDEAELLSDCPSTGGMSGSLYLTKGQKGVKILCMHLGGRAGWDGIDVDKFPFRLFPKSQRSANYCHLMHQDIRDAINR